MKNVIQKLITMFTITLMTQGCEQLAGMDEASKAKAATEGCTDWDGCPWYPEEKDLKWEGCMQIYTQEFTDLGFDCQRVVKSDDSVFIKCVYPQDATQEDIDNVYAEKAKKVRADLVADFGWFKISDKPKTRTNTYYTKSFANNGSSYKAGKVIPNEAFFSITAIDSDNINMLDCSDE